MPKEIADLKVFMTHLAGEAVAATDKKTDKEAQNKPKTVFKKKLTVKHNKRITKFKLRTKKYLYTFKTADGKIVKKILSNLPSNIEKVDVKKSGVAKKK